MLGLLKPCRAWPGEKGTKRLTKGECEEHSPHSSSEAEHRSENKFGTNIP